MGEIEQKNNIHYDDNHANNTHNVIVSKGDANAVLNVTRSDNGTELASKEVSLGINEHYINA